MATQIAWFIAPYKRRTDESEPVRYCAMDDFTPQLRADAGLTPPGKTRVGEPKLWSECECLGNAAVVKVRGANTTLQQIAQAPGFHRLPVAALDRTFTAGQLAALQTFAATLGISSTEWTAKITASSTLRDVLNLLLSRRLQERYDAATDTIVCDGPWMPTRPLAHADQDVA